MTLGEFEELAQAAGLRVRRGVAFTNDKNLADKVSERGAKAVVLLMDSIHNIKVEKERVR